MYSKKRRKVAGVSSKPEQDQLVNGRGLCSSVDVVRLMVIVVLELAGAQHLAALQYFMCRRFNVSRHTYALQSQSLELVLGLRAGLKWSIPFLSRHLCRVSQLVFEYLR